MPSNTRSVARPGPWGNPYAVAEFGTLALALFARTVRSEWDSQLVADLDPALAQRAHAAHVAWLQRIGGDPVARARRELAGHHLACWCRLGTPCHADELLAVANVSG